jgi:hypothetical protein
MGGLSAASVHPSEVTVTLQDNGHDECVYALERRRNVRQVCLGDAHILVGLARCKRAALNALVHLRYVAPNAVKKSDKVLVHFPLVRVPRTHRLSLPC